MTEISILTNIYDSCTIVFPAQKVHFKNTQTKGDTMAHNCNPEDCCGGQEDCPDNDSLDSVETAEYLKMHVKTVIRLAKEGKIPGKKIGSEWQFSRSVLDKWLTSALT